MKMKIVLVALAISLMLVGSGMAMPLGGIGFSGSPNSMSAWGQTSGVVGPNPVMQSSFNGHQLSTPGTNYYSYYNIWNGETYYFAQNDGTLFYPGGSQGSYESNSPTIGGSNGLGGSWGNGPF